MIQRKQVEAALALEIIASYARTMSLVDETRSKARESIEEAIRCGHLLIKAKKDCGGHGHWLPWLKANCPDISDRTAVRLMTLANSPHVADLKNAAGLRQAYILVGIIDEGDAHTSRAAGSSLPVAVERLAVPVGRIRQWFTTRLQQRPVTEWSADERTATKAQLEPLVQLYQQL